MTYRFCFLSGPDHLPYCACSRGTAAGTKRVTVNRASNTCQTAFACLKKRVPDVEIKIQVAFIKCSIAPPSHVDLILRPRHSRWGRHEIRPLDAKAKKEFLMKHQVFGHFFIAALASFGLSGAPVSVQDAPSANPRPSLLPRPGYRFQGNIGRTVADCDPAAFPQPWRPRMWCLSCWMIWVSGRWEALAVPRQHSHSTSLLPRRLSYTRMHTTTICKPT